MAESHKKLENVALPYKTFTSPIDQSPQFVAGRNVLTSQKGYCVQRPGFADFLETTPTQFTNLKAIRGWSLFDGVTFIIMAVDVIGGIPRLYKYIVGQDDSFVLIHVAPSQSTVYNFVPANDVIYFANSVEALKWSPTIGIQKWGIDSPASAGSLSANATAGANSGSGVAWTNPGNVASASSYATVFTSEQGIATNYPLTGGYIAHAVDPMEDGSLVATGKNYGFTIPSGSTILGIEVDFSRWVTTSGLANPGTFTSTVKLLRGGAPVGIAGGPGSPWSLSHVGETYGGSSSLWGTVWTYSDINSVDFGVQVTVSFENDSSTTAGVMHVPNFNITVYYSSGGGGSVSQTLTANSFGFSAPSSFIPSGVAVTFNAGASTSTSSLSVQLVVGGTPVGSPKSVNDLSSSPMSQTLGGAGDLWGNLGLTYSQVNGSNFGVAFIASDGAATTSVNNVSITVYSSGKPSVSLVGSGSLDAVDGGYAYCYTYYNTVSGHESSPSPISDSTGNFSTDAVQVGYGASSDPQVNKINLYRTTDGGSQNPRQMAFLAQVDNATGTFTDEVPDASLSASQFAPAFYQNDPPLPMTALCRDLYAGRVWMVDTTGAKVWYSGQEEISNGVPQECFPGTSVLDPEGNFYSYAATLYAIAPLPDGVAVCTANSIEKIEGDSLDTFRRYRLLSKRGTVTQASVKTVGSSMLWFDVAHQVWLSDLGEIGKDIRPDLLNVSTTTAQMTIHISGEQHWVVLADPDNDLLYVYDLDTGQWMLPWSVDGVTCVESIETAPGVTRLAAGYQGQYVLMENPNLFLDKDQEYNSWAVTLPIELEPSNPDIACSIQWIDVESNAYQPTSVSICTDEDPYALTINSGTDNTFGGMRLVAQDFPPAYRKNGEYLKEFQYKVNSGDVTIPCRRVAVRLDWRSDASPAQWAWYTFDVAYIPLG